MAVPDPQAIIMASFDYQGGGISFAEYVGNRHAPTSAGWSGANGKEPGQPAASGEQITWAMTLGRDVRFPRWLQRSRRDSF
jgi:hypothetical protein